MGTKVKNLKVWDKPAELADMLLLLWFYAVYVQLLEIPERRKGFRGFNVLVMVCVQVFEFQMFV